ncbi:Ferric enterobactin transport system permease protein FepD (TC 3.A.1.14.2) [Citrobacter freundii]|uniref:Ferric enterobactin transport system permease protein FepD (TC 3.A.1.14.2) n=1 Tax=Citrobacter freundii TaxID=546 RepID=A0A7G2ILV6_CITFR|nr:Ferric enterobactin transport system permease protein FepD (TC 3.A.1.14.2) [Citrobacter freundii]
MSCSVSATRAFAVPGLLLLLVLTTVLSLVIGAKSLPASVVLDALTGSCQSADCTIVLDARLPRTLAGAARRWCAGPGWRINANAHA